MQPRYWKTVERHPLSAEYPDITGPEWEDYVDNLREYGIVGGRKIVRLDEKVIDGWQLLRACIEANVKPQFVDLKLPRGMSVEEWVETMNDRRRQETMDVMMERAAKRRERVAAARAEGQSLRTIAATEEISVAQVNRDLEATTCTLGTPEPEKVKGADEKEYPARRPKSKPAKPEESNERTAGIDRLKKRGLIMTGSQLPQTSQLHVKAGAIVHAVNEACEQLEQACEGSDGVLRKGLERFRKILEHADADVDALLNPSATNGRPTKKERGDLFNALADVTGMDKKASGSFIGKVVNSLLKAEPFYTPEEVREFPKILKREFPWMKGRITVGAIEKYIGIVRAEESQAEDLYSGLREFLRRHQNDPK